MRQVRTTELQDECRRVTVECFRLAALVRRLRQQPGPAVAQLRAVADTIEHLLDALGAPEAQIPEAAILAQALAALPRQ